MNVIFIYLFALADQLIHANNEPQGKKMGGESLSSISEHAESDNFSQRVESPRELPVPINDAIYESEMVKNTEVRGFENPIDRLLKLNQNDSKSYNSDDGNKRLRSDLQTADIIRANDTEDDERFTSIPITSRRSGTKSDTNDIVTSIDISEDNKRDSTKIVQKNEDIEKAAENFDSKLFDNTTTNTDENFAIINDYINSRKSSTEGVISGRRRMLQHDDSILDTKARSGIDVRNYDAITQSPNNMIHDQPFNEIERSIPHQSMVFNQQADLELTNLDFTHNNEYDRNTYEYNGYPIQMQPTDTYPNENFQRSHSGTLAPMATTTNLHNTNIQRNINSLITDPSKLSIIKLADMIKRSNGLHFPNPPMLTTPMVPPYFIERFPLLQLGSYKLY
ncbi:hypothetical protein ACJJTC_011398 [Scirpophaga incertulas]